MASFIRSSAFSTMAGIVSLVFGFASSIVVARMLGADGTGGVAFGLWVAMTASMLANLGIPTMLLRYMPRYDRDGNAGGGLARLLFPPFIVPIGLTAVGICVYAYWLNAQGGDFEHSPALWVMTAVLLLSYGIAAYGEAAARGLNKFDETAKMAFYGCLIQLPLIAIGGYFFGVPGAMAGHVARHFPQAVRAFFYIFKPVTPGTEITHKMMINGRNTWLSNALGMLVWSRSEFFFLGLYFSATEIGYYAAGLTLASLVVQLPTQMIAALVPHIGKHHDNDDLFQINRTYQRVMRWLSIFVMPICFGGAAIMSELLPLLFGPDFDNAISMAVILVASACITALTLVPSTIIGARERSDFWLYASPIMAVLSMGSFWLITPHTGGLGTAWVRAAVHSVWFLWLVIFCWRQLQVRLDLRSFGSITLAALLCATMAFGSLQAFGGFLGLVVAVVIGALTYAVALRAFNAIPRDDVIALANNLPGALPARLTDLATKVLLLMVRPG
ncbi:lipopolysaccharide biosynthesis protein [Roseibium sp.]|uniref:lipopolysaccharide biosynthesis protein n=1 Tax=Roseibium sp. TaxID=1936156 RepID=UPI003A96BFCF